MEQKSQQSWVQGLGCLAFFGVSCFKVQDCGLRLRVLGFWFLWFVLAGGLKGGEGGGGGGRMGRMGEGREGGSSGAPACSSVL